MDKEKLWKKFQRKLCYSDEQLKIIRSNPKFVKMVEETPQFVTHKIIAEVIHVHGCIAEHKVGDKFVMNGNGTLLTSECPEKMCLLAIANLSRVVWIMYERFLEGLDPNGIIFPEIQCQDIGVENGGWGKVIMKVYVEGPEKTE